MQENTPIRLAISRYAQKYSQNRTTDMMVDRCRIGGLFNINTGSCAGRSM